MNSLNRFVPENEKLNFVRFALVFMAYISTWAILHDQIVIRIEPRHFTEYHRPLLDISNLTLLAIQYGFIATFGLGIVFGMVTFFLSRNGPLTQLSFKEVFIRFIPFSLIVEFICLSAGYGEYRHFQTHGEHLIYPDSVFPDETLGIAITQTMNLTAYLLAGIGSILFWSYLHRLRRSG